MLYRHSEETKRKISESLRKPLRHIQDENGCFIVISHKSDEEGYISLQRNGKRMSAHRVIWERKFGPIPEGLCILHKCDVRNCINPEHLFLGTKTDNNRDRDQKGRTAQGEKIGRAKLKEQDIHQIRKLLKEGVSQRKIAKIFKVHYATISKINTGKHWKYLREEEK